MITINVKPSKDAATGNPYAENGFVFKAKLGDDLDALVSARGKEEVYKAAIQAYRVGMGGEVRKMVSAGMPEAEINKKMAGYEFGKSIGVKQSKADRIAKTIAALPEDEKQALLAKLSNA